mgnify:CR=1 FL=1
MIGNRAVNNTPRRPAVKKMLNIAALPDGSETKAPPSNCNGGIDDPTPDHHEFFSDDKLSACAGMKTC